MSWEPGQWEARAEKANKLTLRLMKAFPKQVLVADACYALGTIASFFLSKMTDEAFDSWIDALKTSRSLRIKDKQLENAPPAGSA